MKNIGLVIGFISCLCNLSFAQQSQKLKIEEAMVFLTGAQLVNTSVVNLNKGENEIVFTNVAGDVNSQSLSVNATKGVIIESATFKNDYLVTDVLSPRAQAIKDSIELVTVEKEQLANKIIMLNSQIAVFEENRKVGGGNTGLSVVELQKLLDLISTKMENMLNMRNKCQISQKLLDELLTKMNKQLDLERKKDYQPSGRLVIKFYAAEATTSDITITYIVPHAGWSPSYDIKVDDITQPVKLFYKANIYQNSGVRWNNVKLSLSTGNPNESVQAPYLNPWFLAFYVPQAKGYANNIAQSMQPASTVHAYKKALSNGSDMSMAKEKSEESSINNYVTVDNSGVNTTFDIDLPYTIPTDGQKHLVAIKKYEVPASYRYFAVPKLDKDVFLQAQITNWEDLNLLPGESNVFYEGTYLGKGNIDVRNIKDTMTVSLGRDKKIVIKRERDKKLRSVKTIGTNIRETFVYTISVRNSRKEKINLIINDQQPVSNDKDIELEDIETGESEYEPTTGLMKWSLNIEPNKVVNVKFGFTIKYPRGKTVDNLPK